MRPLTIPVGYWLTIIRDELASRLQDHNLARDSVATQINSRELPPCHQPEPNPRSQRMPMAGNDGQRRVRHRIAKAGAGPISAATVAPPIAPASPAVNLVVATPCFGGQISVVYAASLFKLQKLVRSYSDFNLKVLFKDGDALITRARASLISQFLDDPSRDPFAVHRRRYRLRAGTGLAPDRMRRRHVRGDLSHQADRLGQGQERHRDRAAPIPRRRL